MGEFLKKCKTNVTKAVDRCFVSNIANIVLLVVALLLLISLMLSPAILVGLALFGLFIVALLYC